MVPPAPGLPGRHRPGLKHRTVTGRKRAGNRLASFADSGYDRASGTGGPAATARKSTAVAGQPMPFGYSALRPWPVTGR